MTRKILITITLIFLVLQAEAQLQIMTYNIRYDNPNDGEDWWNKRKLEVCQLLEYYHPQFIGIQESMPQQIEFIDKNMPGYAFIGFGRDGEGTESESVPIFYDSAQFELLGWEVFWLSETPEKISRGWDAALNRITTYGAFRNKETGDTLHVFNAHFDHMGEIAREKSAQVILDKIESLGLNEEEVIVMGDLNSRPDEAPIQLLSKELQDAFEHSEISAYGPVGTFNGFDYEMIPEGRIDYVFTQNLKILKFRTINDKRANGRCISDHLPVLVEVE